jgi:iron complex transport system ATP-binding protein
MANRTGVAASLGSGVEAPEPWAEIPEITAGDPRARAAEVAGSFPALSVEDLHVGYRDRLVLQGVTIAVTAGEVVALVGPNGSGKTTLLRAITGLIPRRAGRILLAGSPIEALTRREIARRVAVVAQQPTLPPGYRAREIVLMGRTPHLAFLAQEGPTDRRIADAALALVGAMEIADRPVDELSGGERQKIVLARALAQAAPILLLDEPTANLDVGQQAAVLELVRSLAHREGRAVLLAIHDLTLAALYADRLLLLQAGRLAAEGRANQVLTPPRIAAAYGATVAVLQPEGLPGPVVVPLPDPDGRVAAAGPGAAEPHDRS